MHFTFSHIHSTLPLISGKKVFLSKELFLPSCPLNYFQRGKEMFKVSGDNTSEGPGRENEGDAEDIEDVKDEKQ